MYLKLSKQYNKKSRKTKQKSKKIIKKSKRKSNNKSIKKSINKSKKNHNKQSKKKSNNKSRKKSRKKSIMKSRKISRKKYNNKSNKKSDKKSIKKSNKKLSKRYNNFLIKYNKILGGSNITTMSLETGQLMCDNIGHIIDKVQKNEISSALTRYLKSIITNGLPGSHSIVNALNHYDSENPFTLFKTLSCIPTELINEFTPESVNVLVHDLYDIYNAKSNKPKNSEQELRESAHAKIRCKNACLQKCE